MSSPKERSLREYTARVLAPWSPIIVSNRAPYVLGPQGSLRRGAGGLVTALLTVAEATGAPWVACASTEAEREQAAAAKPLELPSDRSGITLHYANPAPDSFRLYYSVIANPLLWFVQHYLWDLGYTPDITRHVVDAFDNGYLPVNVRFADAVADEVEARGGRVTVMVQDYHLYLVPERVRDRCPEVFLHHFVHIPWPHPDAWRVLPPPMRRGVFSGVLGNDVVAFHSKRFARNFVLGCEELLGLPVDMERLTVEIDGRTVWARSYPISVDPDALRATSASSAVADHEQRLADKQREHLILRVDRADPSKNILRGFRAFDTMLDDHPELTERVTFLALVQPSRQDVKQYVDYLESIRQLVAHVNQKHGTANWQPIELSLEGDFDEVVAAYKLFDVLVVNAVSDGMNLVAKEAALVNKRDGVLALSENAGAHEELGEFAVTLHPFDIQQQADAIFAALMMDGHERGHRLAAAAAFVRENDVAKWLHDQLVDVGELRDLR
ncbi:MAG: trehalose-6-phosphate synthase [Actinomycetota bacterium]|nr:trehalose-6-phosphate synthase [Actinomycetota bacterium]